jgi:hypothetical protein
MELTRRQTLQLAGLISAGVPLLAIAEMPSAVAGTKSDIETMTLEAWADTLIPGAKRYHADYAIAGAARRAGAVQAGAVTFMKFPATGVAAALPAFVSALTAEATSYIGSNNLDVDPTLPPFVALRYRDRKRLVASLTDKSTGDVQLFWFAFSALVFLSYHTAGHLHTAHAVRSGHPGLKAIGFPMPDHDGLWRFPHFSYRRRLAHQHPHTTKGGQPR